jgi:hypothetical protein
MACVEIGIAPGIDDHYPEFALFAVKALIEAIDKTSSSRQIDLMTVGLKPVPGKLTPIDAQRAFTQLRTAVERSTDFSQPLAC